MCTERAPAWRACWAFRPEKVRVQYYEGSGTYGHSCYDDVAQAAALMSQLAAKPVRLQFMRWDELGWDNFGPAHVGQVRAAADASGKLIAYEYEGWQHGWSNTETTSQLTGAPMAEWPGGAVQGVSALNCGGMYDVANLRLVNHKLPVADYLKGGWLRSPLDLSFSFASEQAIDQLAYLLKMDPHEFRQRNIKDPRWLGVLNAAAQAAKWTPRRAASNLSTAKIVTGRGIGVGTHLASYGAAVAEIEVNKETGKVDRQAPVRSHRRRPGGESGQRRGADRRPVGADRQPHVPRRSDVQHHQRHQPGLE